MVVVAAASDAGAVVAVAVAVRVGGHVASERSSSPRCPESDTKPEPAAAAVFRKPAAATHSRLRFVFFFFFFFARRRAATSAAAASSAGVRAAARSAAAAPRGILFFRGRGMAAAPSSPSAGPPPPQWSCEACTLLNNEPAPVCKACQTPRFTDAPCALHAAQGAGPEGGGEASSGGYSSGGDGARECWCSACRDKAGARTTTTCGTTTLAAHPSREEDDGDQVHHHHHDHHHPDANQNIVACLGQLHGLTSGEKGDKVKREQWLSDASDLWQGLRYDKIAPFNKEAARKRKMWNTHDHFSRWRRDGKRKRDDDEGAAAVQVPPWTLLHAVNYELYDSQHHRLGEDLNTTPGPLVQVVFGDLSDDAPVAPRHGWWERL